CLGRVHPAANPHPAPCYFHLQSRALMLRQTTARKHSRHVCLQRRFVLRESRVSVDSIERDLWVGDEIGRESFEVVCQPLDQRDHWLSQERVVPLLTSLEPLAVFISLERTQKCDRLRREPWRRACGHAISERQLAAGGPSAPGTHGGDAARCQSCPPISRT